VRSHRKGQAAWRIWSTDFPQTRSLYASTLSSCLRGGSSGFHKAETALGVFLRLLHRQRDVTCPDAPTKNVLQEAGTDVLKLPEAPGARLAVPDTKSLATAVRALPVKQ